MNQHHHAHSIKRLVTAFGLLFALVVLIYSSTFNASWQMDDHPNITRNERLHLTDLSFHSIFGTFFASPVPSNRHQIYRPVACLTLALNWYAGKTDVTGYHLINIVIHFLTALFLFLTISSLLKSPNIRGKLNGSEGFAALLAAVLWAVHPIQIQAVTYIVQRMAAMAALFYLLGIYCYLRARRSTSPYARIFFWTACVFSYFLALGSKENAAMLPLALILVEVIFFQTPDSPPAAKRIFWCAVGSAFFIMLTGTLFFMKGDIFAFMKGYGIRPFTLGQRLLTEPRVIFLYLSQIVYPVPAQYALNHDIVISTTWFKPWTTLPALSGLILIAGLGLFQIRKRPLLAFAILFFFLNHLIESTIFPLELVFEHRNYLPTLFLFVPVAAGVKMQLDRFRGQRSPLYWGLVILTLVVIMGLGVSTHVRNRAWKTEKSLWEDVLHKSPGLASPYQVLAGHYKKNGDDERALAFYQRALSLKSQRPTQSRALALNNMGNLYADRGEYERAIGLYLDALKVYPGYERSLHNLTLALLKSGQLPEARRYADELNSRFYNQTYLNLNGFILIKLQKPAEAIPFLVQAVRLAPYERNAAVNLGVAMALTGQHDQAEKILTTIQRKYPNDIVTLLCLIETHLRSENTQGADNYSDKLFAVGSIITIKDILGRPGAQNSEVPFTHGILAPYISEKIKARSKKIYLP
jgi:Tfp pilus assembly protein PilF